MGIAKTTGCLGIGCGGIVFLLLCFMIFALLMTASNHPDSMQPSETYSSSVASNATKPVAPKKEDSGAGAYIIAKEYCESSLKAPSTAKFSSLGWDSDTGWSRYGFNQWKVYGHVDAQNTFGAMLRSHWSAVVKKTGDDNYKIQFFKLDNQTFGFMPKPDVEPLSPSQLVALKQSQEAQQHIKSSESAQKTLEFHQKLAAQGDAYGQFQMGMRYLTGDGVEKDPAKARDLLAKSSAQGYQEATTKLAKLPAP